MVSRSIALSLLVLVLVCSATAQTPPSRSADGKGAADVVRAFWQAVGDLDGDRVVACLDWPNVIVETSDRGTKPAKTVVDGDAVKAEIARSRENLHGSRRGSFFGATVTTLDVRPLNATLVYVPHRCSIIGDGPGSSDGERREFDAVAIVRKDEVTQTWRIMVITVAR